MLTSLIIKDIQIKTYNQNYLTPRKWPSSSKKFTNDKSWRGCGEKETSHTVGRDVNWYSHCAEQHGDSLKAKNRATV